MKYLLGTAAAITMLVALPIASNRVDSCRHSQMTEVLGVIKMNVFHLPGDGPREVAEPVTIAQFKGSNSLQEDGNMGNLGCFSGGSPTAP